MRKLLERDVRIFNIQKYSLYDGPGVRTLIFFQGCPLQCKWCSNPEGLKKKSVLMYKKDSCRHCLKCLQVCLRDVHKSQDGRHYIDRDAQCDGCRRCEKVCTTFSLKTAGEVKKISELLEVIEEDRMFYETSGGGVTLGGGEVLMQPEGAISLLGAIKNAGINTAIETCGYTSEDIIRRAAEYTDLFLFDLKHIDSDKHYYWTGVRNERILSNLKVLMENNSNIQIRVPLMKGVNDDSESIKMLMDFLSPYTDYKNLKGIDLLPYHKMGVNKYKQLDMEYSVEEDLSLTDERLNEIETLIKGFNLPAKVIRH